VLRLTDTLTGEKHEIRGPVRMYSCGPTVYRPQHVGNMRSYLLSDLIARTLAYHRLDVQRIMNITDVGHMTDELSDTGRDKMLLAADDENLTTAEIAAKYTDAFFRDTDAIGIRRADLYPKATEHIPQIIELITKLIEREHAYENGGTVYYDVTSFPGYGKLSHQSLDDMRAGHRIENVDSAKRNHQDFTMWVAAGPRRELVYESPWGPGYPGWHIECSAMSLHYFGERFEVHTGGIDNRFPHHEDEIAQSEGAVGHPVVDTWVHGEHLLMAQAKMAKSAGNVITIENVIADGIDPLAFRYLCFTGRYRRQVDFTPDALNAAATALRRLREQAAMLGPPAAEAPAGAYHDRFIAAVDDDLDFPQAVLVLHEVMADRDVAPERRAALIRSWDEILGLRLFAEEPLTPELQELVGAREAAREARDFTRADAIREQLRSQGIELLDSPQGTRWVRR
jgi:cysteinyl-tRNA synthetase